MDHVGDGSINNDPILENEEDVNDDSEDRELVNDSCSTKVLESPEPRDRYCIVYMLFYLFGITSLIPWNFLITANDVSNSTVYIIIRFNVI